MSGGGGHLCELKLQYQTTRAFLPWNASGHLYSDTDPHAARDHGSCFRFMYLQEKGGSYVLHMFFNILFQVCPEWGPGLPGGNRFQDGSAQIVAGVVFWSRSGEWPRSMPGTVTAGRGSPQPWRKPRMGSRTLHPVLVLTLPSCVTLRDYPELASLQHEPHHAL